MRGSRDLEELYAFYREPKTARRGGTEMIRFLDSVADILRAKLVYYGTSHETLFLTLAANYPECNERPTVHVQASGRFMNLSYQEHWKDGDYLRSRWESNRCPAEQARAAFLELIARLKPADAEPDNDKNRH